MTAPDATWTFRRNFIPRRPNFHPHPRLGNGRPSNASPSLPDSARNRPECYRSSTTTEQTAQRQVQKKELRRPQRRTQRNCPRRTTQTHLHLHSPHHSPRPATSERHHRRPKHKRPFSENGGARADTHGRVRLPEPLSGDAAAAESARRATPRPVSRCHRSRCRHRDASSRGTCKITSPASSRHRVSRRRP